jgi:sulfur carrier protein ThiS
MQVTFKLYAQLGVHLPPGHDRNQIVIDVPEGTTIWDVIDAHNVPRGSCHLVLVNGHYHAPAARGTVQLQPGDALAIWPPIAGG